LESMTPPVGVMLRKLCIRAAWQLLRLGM
jgi:hypothetical protein